MEATRNEDDKRTKKKGKKHPIIYRSNPAQLLVEESLMTIINKSKGLGYKACRSSFAPRNKHSPFGDFPKEYITKKQETFDLDPIDNQQVSSSVKGDEDNKSLSLKIKNRQYVNKGVKTPYSGAFNPRKIETSSFRLHYDRGDLPILVEHYKGYKIKWDEKQDFEKFDYQLYLPIFVEGIREKMDPYRFLAIQGTFDLLDLIKDTIVKVIPQLILPLKKALNTRDPEIILITLKIIQRLATCSDLAGEALVPYYRQLLPIFNVFINNNKNLGDKIDYGQRKKRNLGDLIQETLEILEQQGGDVSL